MLDAVINCVDTFQWLRSAHIRFNSNFFSCFCLVAGNNLSYGYPFEAEEEGGESVSYLEIKHHHLQISLLCKSMIFLENDFCFEATVSVLKSAAHTCLGPNKRACNKY